MRNSHRFVLCVMVTAGLTACGGGEQRQIIQNKGSDTLVNVAQAWAEAYQQVEPGVVVAVTGGGSGTGIAALINGTVDIANASRKMKPKEIEAAKARARALVPPRASPKAMSLTKKLSTWCSRMWRCSERRTTSNWS